MNPKREPGIYWVRRSVDQQWSVAEWKGGKWYRMGSEDVLGDADLSEIGERVTIPEKPLEP